MKRRTSLMLFALLCAPALFADTPQRLIPAGSLISCTLSEPRLSSKNTAIGDPVLCQVGHAERYGRSVLPYNSYLVGRFEDYRDPGHFVGKGWMELRFDRMVIEPDTVIPIDARVVDVPGYRVDSAGRIQGKGHAVRDTILWTIPILWPIDLINLPRRGPRPTLKEETRLTLKVMDDLAVPQYNQPGPQADPYGLMHRQPSAELTPPPPQPEPQPERVTEDMTPPQPAYAQPMYAAQPMYPPPPVYAYAAPVVIAPPPVVYAYPPPMVMVPRMPVVLAYPPMAYVPRGQAAYPPRGAASYAPQRSYGYPGYTRSAASYPQPARYAATSVQ